MLPVMMKEPVGHLLRVWRERRRMSQLDLSADAEISSRHLSFIETGRSIPSREMVLRLADRLEIPLRERNVLLSAAGYAAVFAERSLADPSLEPARRAIDALLVAHEPYPALVIDRHWTLMQSNAAVRRLLGGVEPKLLEPPVNVLRLALHPGGLAPRTKNLGEWRAHLLSRLQRQIELTADAVLLEMMQELKSYPAPSGGGRSPAGREFDGLVVPFKLMTERGLLTFLSTTTVFGTPVEITLSELAIESFFPADAETAEILRNLAPPDNLHTAEAM